MSVAEPLPPISKKLQVYQKWYMLFPANWAQLAFDREWRTKRLIELASNQGTRCFSYWVGVGVVGFLTILNGVGASVSSGIREDYRSQHTTLFVALVFIFLLQTSNYLKLEVERILLQIIDRLEQESSHDV
jgi:hypothetical protein